jgi:phenylacetate-CoA ligase
MWLTYRVLRDLRRAVRRSPDELRAIQEARLRALVRRAYDRVAYVRRLWDAAGVGPDDVQGLEDVRRIPFVTKALLQETPLAELLERGVRPERCTLLDTSGSTGRPLRIYKRAHEERFRRAGGLRILLEHGFRWHHRTAQFQILAGPRVWLQGLGIAPKWWVSTAQPMTRQLRQLAEARPHVWVGTPTALRNAARGVQQMGLRLEPARLVVAAGELLEPATRQLLRAVLGADPISVYGTTETGYLAWQCERRELLHVNADTHLVEILRGERPAVPGELGEVVVTDLVAHTLPLLRYRTGDLARAPLGACACGRGLPTIEVVGRASTTLQLPGRLVPLPEVVAALAGVAPVGAFLVRQDEAGRIRLELREPAGAPAALARLSRLVAPLPVDAVEVEGWPDPGTGKTPIVKSALELKL